MILFFYLFISPSLAYAYVDPVNGAMLLQLLLSGVAGILMLVRHKLKLLWRRMLGKSDTDTDAPKE
jgi:hypothetical protein